MEPRRSRVRRRTVHRLLIPLGLALSLTLASCSSDEDCASAAGVAQSCAAGVGYDGHFYQEWSGKLPAVGGPPQGGSG
jgi:hypothetical protein